MSSENNGYLVVQAENSKKFYLSESSSKNIMNSNWKEITINFSLPEYADFSIIKIYCYNPYLNYAFFDDLIIKCIE